MSLLYLISAPVFAFAAAAWPCEISMAPCYVLFAGRGELFLLISGYRLPDPGISRVVPDFRTGMGFNSL